MKPVKPALRGHILCKEKVVFNLIKISSTNLLLPPFFGRCVVDLTTFVKGRVRGQHEYIKTDRSTIHLQIHEDNLPIEGAVLFELDKDMHFRTYPIDSEF